MSDEVSTEEWKTIRISASAYYKLVELSGFLTVILGSQQITLSSIANVAIVLLYDSSYKQLREVVMDADKLEKMRVKLGGDLKRLFDLWIKPKLE